jgi:hypothetical protein
MSDPRQETRQPPADDGELLARIERPRDGTELRVSWSSYEGHPFVSARVWFRGDDGVMRPDRARGLSIRLKELETVHAAIGQALDRAIAHRSQQHRERARQSRQDGPEHADGWARLVDALARLALDPASPSRDSLQACRLLAVSMTAANLRMLARSIPRRRKPRRRTMGTNRRGGGGEPMRLDRPGRAAMTGPTDQLPATRRRAYPAERPSAMDHGSEQTPVTDHRGPRAPRFRLRLLDVMAMVFFAAIVLALYVFCDSTVRPGINLHEPAFAIYVAVLSAAAIAARAGRKRWRPFWSGVVVFGGLYLVTGLHLGWGVGDYQASASLLFRCQIALPLGILCGMAAQWLMAPTSSTTEHGG